MSARGRATPLVSIRLIHVFSFLLSQHQLTPQACGLQYAPLNIQITPLALVYLIKKKIIFEFLFLFQIWNSDLGLGGRTRNRS